MTRKVGHGFTIALGLAGWFVVLVFPALGIVPPPSHTPLLWTSLFVIVILAARALAFRLTTDSVLSLDSAYYVAAALCVGSVGAGRLVAVALTLDASVRLYLARRRQLDDDHWATSLGYVAYFGGMSGALVVITGALFGADHVASSPSVFSVDRTDALDVALHVVAIATLFLVTHYTIQGVRLRLLGASWRTYLYDLALPGIIAEASLMPIGVVLVLLYDPNQPLGFLLLSLTYLLINLVFSRLSRTRRQLEARVHDLEILNATARRLSASLQLEELVEAVARETCRAIPEAEAVALVHRRAGGESGFVLDGFDGRTERFFRQPMQEGQGAAGWVMARGMARRFDDLASADVDIHDTQGIRSWLGVPLFMYGGCEGVIAVQSTRAAAFRADHQRLLESLGLQIAAALQNAHLYELAMVDGLTGLFMRRYFDARIEEEIERSKRYGTPFSVIMMDVDDFKKLNDEHGHLIGDRVLRSIANVVKAQMRGVDTAARYGGEEIALILPRTDMVSAYNVGERIRAAIAETRVTTDSDPPRVLSVTSSFGIASYPETKAKNGEDLVRKADRALYRAKKTGKNRVELFWSDDSGPARIPELAQEDVG
ncbi:MAG: sensor domain-containing diguanylate cyclase [Deltaproteobacteria bacterium]|nr:sensor domain-containing diguanylate cyclase [Deltaproteobacteria bacterium]MCW5804448.1 sensor domain-containing diguanylate cyclase [Deltaproteobacteria bacterium]